MATHEILHYVLTSYKWRFNEAAQLYFASFCILQRRDLGRSEGLIFSLILHNKTLEKSSLVVEFTRSYRNSGYGFQMRQWDHAKIHTGSGPDHPISISGISIWRNWDTIWFVSISPPLAFECEQHGRLWPCPRWNETNWKQGTWLAGGISIRPEISKVTAGCRNSQINERQFFVLLSKPVWLPANYSGTHFSQNIPFSLFFRTHSGISWISIPRAMFG